MGLNLSGPTALCGFKPSIIVNVFHRRYLDLPERIELPERPPKFYAYAMPSVWGLDLIGRLTPEAYTSYLEGGGGGIGTAQH